LDITIKEILENKLFSLMQWLDLVYDDPNADSTGSCSGPRDTYPIWG
jgi:hypothetical protein